MTQAPSLSIRRSRGMRDLLPAEMRAFRRVEDAFRSAAGRWGYEEVRTPAIETYSLFTVTGGLSPQMLSRVYSFLDWDGWSGERVVLRPDSTIPVARAAAESGLELPARLFYVQNVFRFREEGDREDWQCGIEYLGAPAGIGDLEVIVAGCETLDALGPAPAVRLGHVGVSRAIAEAAIATGNGDLRAMLDRVAAEGVGALKPAATDPRLAAFVELAARPSPELPYLDNLDALARNALPRATAAIAEVRAIASALVDTKRAVTIDFGMPRDFEYYTGVVFEFEANGGPWGQGGRYAPGGEDTAATACGLALEAGKLAARLAPSMQAPAIVHVVPAGAGDVSRAMAIARALHRAGIPAALASGPGTLAVRVEGKRNIASTPDGESEAASLEDLVSLLMRFK